MYLHGGRKETLQFGCGVETGHRGECLEMLSYWFVFLKVSRPPFKRIEGAIGWDLWFINGTRVGFFFGTHNEGIRLNFTTFLKAAALSEFLEYFIFILFLNNIDSQILFLFEKLLGADWLFLVGLFWCGLRGACSVQLCFHWGWSCMFVGFQVDGAGASQQFFVFLWKLHDGFHKVNHLIIALLVFLDLTAHHSDHFIPAFALLFPQFKYLSIILQFSFRPLKLFWNLSRMASWLFTPIFILIQVFPQILWGKAHIHFFNPATPLAILLNTIFFHLLLIFSCFLLICIPTMFTAILLAGRCSITAALRFFTSFLYFLSFHPKTNLFGCVFRKLLSPLLYHLFTIFDCSFFIPLFPILLTLLRWKVKVCGMPFFIFMQKSNIIKTLVT